jgi:mono/diheme cytochrome c family protein
MRIASLGVLAGSLVFASLLVAQNDNYTPDPAWKAPPSAAAKRNPLAKDPAAVKKGQELYEAQCSMCHGMDGRGIANAANLHEPAVQRQSDGSMFWKITNGNPDKGMPSFQQIPGTDRWQLVSFIRTFKDTTKSAQKE